MNYTSITSIATNSTIAIIDYSDEDGSTNTNAMCYESDTMTIINNMTMEDKSEIFKSFDELPPESGMIVIIGFIIVVFLTLVVAPLLPSSEYK